ncbi:MAG: hypothetical protein R2813_08445 [Flavobacteriales bacterium]
MSAEKYIKSTFIFGLFISCLCLFDSCRKEQEMTVYGDVLDGNTKELLSSIPIILSYSSVQNGVYSSGYSLLAKGSTNESGNYRLDFERSSVVDYLMEVNAPEYFLYQEKVDRDEWSPKEENRYDIELYLATNLRLHIVNRTSASNTLTLDMGDHSPNCPSCCPQEKLYFSGLVDTILDCKIYGNQIVPYTANVINSLNSSDVSGEINLNNQVVEYEIFF